MKKLLLIAALSIAGIIVATSMPQNAPTTYPADAKELYRAALRLEQSHPDSALQLLRQSAVKGFPQAQNYLGYHLLTMPGAAADSGLMWIERAAEAGDPGAWNNLGFLLSTGYAGVCRDTAKATYWFERSAEAGHAAGSAQLAYLLLRSATPSDSLRARRLLAYASSRGLEDAGQHLLSLESARLDTLRGTALLDTALSYYNRHITPVAAYLLRRSALEDNPLATAITAFCTSVGAPGFDYDYNEALRLYMKAALLGDPSAQFIVAETLEITPDAFESVADPSIDWRARAAEAGITDSREAFSRLRPVAPPR